MKSTPRKTTLRSRTLLSCAVSSALLLASASVYAQSSYQEAGVIGNPESWRSAEFQRDWGLGAIGADYAYARGLTGAGIKTGVLDDGTDVEHAELVDSVDALLIHQEGCASREFINGPQACYYNDGDVAFTYTDVTEANRALLRNLVNQGAITQEQADALLATAGFKYSTHGTHVAGTILAHRDGSGMHGVAYGATALAAGFSSDTYRNLEAVDGSPGAVTYTLGPGNTTRELYEKMNAQGVRAINNSWGLGQEPATMAEMDAAAADAEFNALTGTIRDATKAYKYLQVFAAGNDKGQIAGIYATLPRYDKELEPYWLSVANLNKNGSLDASSSICGLSKDWCITAPGTDINSAIPEGDIAGEVLRYADGSVQGLRVTDENRLSGYADQTGSSMATPHVTGGLALLMERFPYLDNAQVRDVLLTTATDLGAAGIDEIYGWGLMDLKKAIDGPGSLRVDTEVVMDEAAGGTKVWEGAAWDDWRNDISGPGHLTKSGVGWLRLSGANSFAGVTVSEGVLELDGINRFTDDSVVQGGELLLNGQLVDSALYVDGGIATLRGTIQGGITDVGAGGTLRGHGTLDTTVVAGTIAPGENSLATLTVDGDYTQQAGSVYAVDVAPVGQSDRIVVTGKATLEGGTVRVSGPATLGDHYQVLSAADVQGQFAGAEGASSPFLKFNLAYLPTAVNLDVGRGAALASAAYTPNEVHTALAADALADSNPLLRELTRLSAPEAKQAFNRLNGELHASQQSVLVLQGQRLAESTLSRTRSLQDSFAFAQQDKRRNGVWVDLQRMGGHLDGDGNAARTRYDSQGLAIGYDYAFGDGWNVGGLAARLSGDTDVRDRAAKAEHRSTYFGVYGGKAWGAFGLRAGWLGSRHRIDSDRSVQWTGYADHALARHDADGQQFFADAGYRFQVGRSFQIEPFAQWSRVQVKSGAFVETAGLGSLDVASNTQRVDFATGGVRMAANLSPGGGQDWLQLGGALAYRQASGDVAAASTANWVGGSDFTVWGAPIGKRATVLNLQVGARVSPNSLLELGYDGQYGRDARDHGIQARYSLKF